MDDQEDIVSVHCPCGDSHQFAREYVGRIARCPKLNQRFQVPTSSGPVSFIVDAQAARLIEHDEKDMAGVSHPKRGGLIKRAGELYQEHKRKREIYKQAHCRCPHCQAENLTRDFMCVKCGCPLHDDRAAFLFMEKRRQEAHELKLAEAQRDLERRRPTPVARPAGPPAQPPPVITQKVIVRHGSGCLSIIGAIVVIMIIILMIPICSGPLFVSSNSAKQSPSRSPKVTPEKGMGETLHVGYTSYCVWRAWFSERLSSNQFLNRRPSAKWLFLDVSVRNNDKKPRMIPPFKLVDENGALYESATEGGMIENAIGVLETLNPSVTKQGLVVFDVPADRKYRLQASGGYWSGEEAYIRIVPGPAP